MSSGPPPWWPHVERSRLVEAGGLRWHVQRWPKPGAPVALLLHGTGSSAHSWRQVAPRLADEFDVVVPDLPGHAFTPAPASQALSLPAVAQAVGALCRALDLRPDLLVGHSAGAAIALRMVLDALVAPGLTVSINGAVLPLQGPVGRLFLPVARLLVANPLVPPAFAWWARAPGVAQRLLDSTGSTLDEEGRRCYAHLVADPAHAAGALRLMASWDLQPLADDLRHLWHAPLLLVAGEGDRTLPASHSERVQAEVRNGATCVLLPRLGHLAHEEDAAAVLRQVRAAWRRGAPAQRGGDSAVASAR